MNEIFNSNFQENIRGFLSEKRTLGYTYKVDAQHLLHFDRYCLLYYPDQQELTQEIITSWAMQRSTENNGGLSRRITTIREFGKYVARSGNPSFILPPNMYPRRIKYPPHIFTDEELHIFFRAADSIIQDHRSPSRFVSAPVALRVMYCCGLRPSELVSLKTKDVDLETGIITVRQSKGKKDRAVMLSEDVASLCRRYRKYVEQRFVRSEYFFCMHNGRKYSTQWLRDTFHDCYRLAGEDNFASPVPRLYDLRHSFATRCLYNWLMDGRDLQAWFPYLSAYMGHVEFEDTAYYIHLVPQFFPYIQDMNTNHYAHLIPEVEHDI